MFTYRKYFVTNNLDEYYISNPGRDEMFIAGLLKHMRKHVTTLWFRFIGVLPFLQTFHRSAVGIAELAVDVPNRWFTNRRFSVSKMG
jgi:hypothetical protein